MRSAVEPKSSTAGSEDDASPGSLTLQWRGLWAESPHADFSEWHMAAAPTASFEGQLLLAAVGERALRHGSWLLQRVRQHLPLPGE
mmetsp:Transcript_126578/g.205753  ORF Transcript_126578/g.205753 Transcript_126578/m.205753 type:complete len:86 (-) Transcript_126578:598-855(-)